MKGTSNAPSTKNVLTAKQGPDGSERYGFWSSELKSQRKEWFKLVGLTFILITLTMFLMLSVYFGSYYDQIPRADFFSVQIIDLDSLASTSSATHAAILGPAVETAVQNALNTLPHLGWFFADTSVTQQFNLTSNGRGVNVFDYAVQEVLNQDFWAVLIINANATSGIWNAVTGGTSWDPTGAMTFIYEEARNFYGTDQYVSRLGTQLMTKAADSASATFANQVLALGNASAVLAAAPSGTVSGGFSYNQHNLAPFDQTGGIPATTVGTVYLIIFTFLFSPLWNNTVLPTIQERLTLFSEVLLKILVPWFAYFWISLHYSLVSLAFLVAFNRKYGKIGFFLYWMANFVTMSGLGFVMETFFLWLGPFFPFFLVFWVIINVSVAFLSIANMSDFYRYGYVLPVWNLVDTAKSIIFATKNHLLQNFAVNLGWMFAWMIILATTTVVQRRRKEVGNLKAKWEEMKRIDEDRTIGQAL